MRNFTLVSLLVLTALHSGAVSRVGGGKIKSTSSEFEMTIPAPFEEIYSYADSVRAMGPIAYLNGLGMQRTFIDVTEFREERPTLALANARDIREEFLAQGWEEISKTDCPLHFRKADRSFVAHSLAWGQGKGFVLKGVSTNEVASTMNSMLQSLKLQGACSWK